MAEQIKIVREYLISNKLGLHARPATLFVKTATTFTAEVTVAKDGHVSDGKSIIGLLMLAAGQGSLLNVTATGGDAAEALDALEKLIESKFDED